MGDQWHPEQEVVLPINGASRRVGIDSYRFYVWSESEGRWESCLEFKHDSCPHAHDLADFLFDLAQRHGQQR